MVCVFVNSLAFFNIRLFCLLTDLVLLLLFCFSYFYFFLLSTSRARTSWYYVEYQGESEFLVLFLSLGEKLSVFPLVSIILAVGLSWITLSCWERPLLFLDFEGFYHERVLKFIRCFSFLNWDCVWFFSPTSILLMWLLFRCWNTPAFLG